LVKGIVQPFELGARLHSFDQGRTQAFIKKINLILIVKFFFDLHEGIHATIMGGGGEQDFSELISFWSGGIQIGIRIRNPDHEQ
jgi:hypothetical protein